MTAMDYYALIERMRSLSNEVSRSVDLMSRTEPRNSPLVWLTLCSSVKNASSEIGIIINRLSKER